MDKNCGLVTKTVIFSHKKRDSTVEATNLGDWNGDSISKNQLDDMSQPLKIGMEIGLNFIWG